MFWRLSSSPPPAAKPAEAANARRWRMTTGARMDNSRVSICCFNETISSRSGQGREARAFCRYCEPTVAKPGDAVIMASNQRIAILIFYINTTIFVIDKTI
jgi:hypothetical protein